MKPIIAVATPAGKGSISVLRMSGEGCIAMTEKRFSPFPKQANLLQLGQLSLTDFCDKAMAVFFPAPHSFTGEDMVELHLHGGHTLTQEVLKFFVQNGCKMAEKGEFTKRAFLNGKLDLTQAEGIVDLIDAESKRAIKNAYQQVNGKLHKKIDELQDGLTDLLAQIEVAMDYPEEDLETLTKKEIEEKMSVLHDEVRALLSTARTGQAVKNGIDVAIVGKANAGKSSLLNSLVGFERAIVTDIAGTTRDTVEQSFVFCDIKFNFIDTAGLRETQDIVEQMGIERAKQKMQSSQIVLYLFEDLKDFDKKIAQQSNVLPVFSKTDKNKCPDGFLGVSTKDEGSVEKLKQKLFDMSIDKASNDQMLVSNARYVQCLHDAEESFLSAKANLNMSLDCVAVDLKQAWHSLGEITGKTASEEVVNRIFEKFCVGK